jgi:hypothetical protein
VETLAAPNAHKQTLSVLHRLEARPGGQHRTHRPARSRFGEVIGSETIKRKENMNGVQLIAAERTRQIVDEGWTAEHDEQHSRCEMAPDADPHVRWCGRRGEKSPRRPDSVAITGEITFYHGAKRGRPIRIGCRSDAHREELLQKLCDDPEVGGFEIAWDKPQNRKVSDAAH